MKNCNRALFWILGFFLLGFLFHKVGADKIWKNLHLMGWGFIPVLGISLLWNLCNTWAWAVCFHQGDRPSFFRLLWTKLCAEAIGNITPISHLGGEVAKVYMLRRQIGVLVGLPSLVVNKTIEMVSGLGFVFVGAVIAFEKISMPEEMRMGILIVLLAGGLGMAGIVLKQRKNTFGWLFDILEKFQLSFLEGKRGKVEELDKNIAAFYKQNRNGFLVSLSLHTFSWVLSIVEIFVILWILDESISMFSAFLLSSLSVVINSAFFFVPSGVGVFEGGHMFLFHLLGLNAGLGLGVGIIRRIRKLFWIGIGFLMLVFKVPLIRQFSDGV